MNINKELEKYIEDNIFPSYKKNDSGHNLDHIKYVIKRSFMFAKTIDNINYDMVYTIASYHDIGHYIDAKNHEKVSAEMLLQDNNLKEFFTEDEIKIMAEAVADHRASSKQEPRSIYGKIVSSADRNTSLKAPLRRAYLYRIAHKSGENIEDIIEESRMHIQKKFGSSGYATEKMYFEDNDYKVFLKEISKLVEDKEKFKKVYCEVNNINLKYKPDYLREDTIYLNDVFKKLTEESTIIGPSYIDIVCFKKDNFNKYFSKFYKIKEEQIKKKKLKESINDILQYSYNKETIDYINNIFNDKFGKIYNIYSEEYIELSNTPFYFIEDVYLIEFDKVIISLIIGNNE